MRINIGTLVDGYMIIINGVNIKKGMKVSEFMVTKEAKCKCCGINSLHTYEDWVMKRKMWEQMMQQEVMNPSPDLDYLK